MAVTGFELVVVATEYVTADIIVWKKYRRPCPGIVEVMLDANPQLALVHRTTPFIPVGTYVRVPVDPALMAGKQPVMPVSSIWGPGA
jgi:phage tail protein X